MAVQKELMDCYALIAKLGRGVVYYGRWGLSSPHVTLCSCIAALVHTSCPASIATLGGVVCAMADGPVLPAVWSCLKHKHSHEVSRPPTLPRIW